MPRSGCSNPFTARLRAQSKWGNTTLFPYPPSPRHVVSGVPPFLLQTPLLLLLVSLCFFTHVSVNSTVPGIPPNSLPPPLGCWPRPVDPNFDPLGPFDYVVPPFDGKRGLCTTRVATWLAQQGPLLKGQIEVGCLAEPPPLPPPQQHGKRGGGGGLRGEGAPPAERPRRRGGGGTGRTGVAVRAPAPGP